MSIKRKDKCVICDKILQKRNSDRRIVCTGCANDCLNGMFGQIGKTIEKRIKKEVIKLTSQSD